MVVGNSLWFDMVGPGRAARARARARSCLLRIDFSCCIYVGGVERRRRVVGLV